MTRDERQAIIDSDKRGEIGNATAYAKEFAAERGLNAATVRCEISRLRRDRGETRRRNVAPKDAALSAAFVLLRYEREENFRVAVDEQLVPLRVVSQAWDGVVEAVAASSFDPNDQQIVLETIVRELTKPPKVERAEVALATTS